MRVAQVLGCVLSLVGTIVSLSVVAATEPEILAVGAFPESNPFGHVVNGEKNKVVVDLENKSDRNVTLLNIAGAVYNSASEKLVRNLTTQTYGLPLLEGSTLQLPYTFFSEFKLGDLRLKVWAEYSSENAKYKISAYDSIVKIVEPEASIFDIKLILTYILVSAFFGGLTYLAYLSFFPAPKVGKKKTSVPSVSAPVGSVTATTAGGYQEEWIPEHHLKKPKTGRKASGVVSGTSGDELSGGEVSGTEGRKRKGRK